MGFYNADVIISPSPNIIMPAPIETVAAMLTNPIIVYVCYNYTVLYTIATARLGEYCYLFFARSEFLHVHSQYIIRIHACNRSIFQTTQDT